MFRVNAQSVAHEVAIDSHSNAGTEENRQSKLPPARRAGELSLYHASARKKNPLQNKTSPVQKKISPLQTMPVELIDIIATKLDPMSRKNFREYLPENAEYFESALRADFFIEQLLSDASPLTDVAPIRDSIQELPFGAREPVRQAILPRILNMKLPINADDAADILPNALQDRFDDFLKAHGMLSEMRGDFKDPHRLDELLRSACDLPEGLQEPVNAALQKFIRMPRATEEVRTAMLDIFDNLAKLNPNGVLAQYFEAFFRHPGPDFELSEIKRIMAVAEKMEGTAKKKVVQLLVDHVEQDASAILAAEDITTRSERISALPQEFHGSLFAKLGVRIASGTCSTEILQQFVEHAQKIAVPKPTLLKGLIKAASKGPEALKAQRKADVEDASRALAFGASMEFCASRYGIYTSADRKKLLSQSPEA